MTFALRPLGEISDVTIGRQRSPKHTAGPDPMPYIRAANVKDGRLDLSTVLTMDFSPDEQHRYGLEHGDVLVTEGCGSPAELGASTTWRDELTGFVGFQNHVLRLRPRAGLSDSRFLGPLARWCHHAGRWRNIASGTSILNIGLGRARDLLVPAPSVHTQERIGAIFDAIDELVLNGERRVEILETMTQAIYREWFVRFRFPGHEQTMTVDSAHGSIPSSWSHVTLDQSARWLSGGTPSTKNPGYWGGDIPWITSGTLTSLLLDRSERMVSAKGLANGTRLVDRDTLLFVVRGMSLVKEFRVGIADRPLSFGQDCKALVARPGIQPLFLAFAVITMADEIQGMVELAGHGTGKLSTDRLKSLLIPHPPEPLQAMFVETISPMRETMSQLRGGLYRLKEIRDLLLPKLITGQIDVSSLDLDTLVDSVA